MILNETDKRLIALLRINARMPLSTLAKKLNVSRTTVQNRLERLESSGVISGYTVTLKPSIEQEAIHALMFISVESRQENKVIDILRGFPSVSEIHYTHGHWDLVLEMRATNLVMMHEMLLQIRDIPSVLNTETTLLLSSVKK